MNYAGIAEIVSGGGQGRHRFLSIYEYLIIYKNIHTGKGAPAFRFPESGSLGRLGGKGLVGRRAILEFSVEEEPP
jgi:hypothetical protein